MSKVFVVTNQHGHFLDKHREWVDGRDPKVLFRSPHKDEAINLVFEVSSKDIYLRAEAIAVDLDDRGQPEVDVTTELPTARELEQKELQQEGRTDAAESTAEAPDDSGLEETDAPPAEQALATH